MTEHWLNSIKISIKHVSKIPTNNNSAFVQAMDWTERGDKPSHDVMLTYIYDATGCRKPQWVQW